MKWKNLVELWSDFFTKRISFHVRTVDCGLRILHTVVPELLTIRILIFVYLIMFAVSINQDFAQMYTGLYFLYTQALSGKGHTNAEFHTLKDQWLKMLFADVEICYTIHVFVAETLTFPTTRSLLHNLLSVRHE